ncbi:uncharacterized protein [Miscanthus floridulus]|uniref:uncharacterized protein isoform X2 n=1 Tax=Miscanthus floridulus TaxID=154761 RepID=UPI003459B0E0
MARWIGSRRPAGARLHPRRVRSRGAGRQAGRGSDGRGGRGQCTAPHGTGGRARYPTPFTDPVAVSVDAAHRTSSSPPRNAHAHALSFHPWHHRPPSSSSLLPPAAAVVRLLSSALPRSLLQDDPISSSSSSSCFSPHPPLRPSRSPCRRGRDPQPETTVERGGEQQQPAAEEDPRRRPDTPPTMGRGKIEIKRIENTTNRQVTYSKRRTGIMKKARELTVLCDAHVAIIMFSSTGKYHEFCSPGTDIKTIFDRYQQAIGTSLWNEQYENMQRTLSHLKDINRNLRTEIRQRMGEDLDTLEFDELRGLEQNVDAALKEVRHRKYHVITTQTETYKKKKLQWGIKLIIKQAPKILLMLRRRPHFVRSAHYNSSEALV